MSLVEIDMITIGSSRRPLREERIYELMESIKTNGLLNPITLDQNYNLIAGLHRLTACKLLGLKEIECCLITCDADQAHLAEIDENLIRAELSTLERAELWLERDRIFNQMGLRAKPGDNQYSQQGGEMISPPPKTTLELAQQAGYTDRTFQLGKQIARDIAPAVKEQIKGTLIAKSTTALLKVARAGSEERKQAEQAEQAAQAAKAAQQTAELAKQAKLAAAARRKQEEIQLAALQGTVAEKAAKTLTPKTVLRSQTATPPTVPSLAEIQPGDEWLLDRHLLYCGQTSSNEFVDRLPSDAALAIAVPSAHWHHDYLVDEARVVAVICPEGTLHNFCRQHQMPFRFEFFLEGIYLAVFSHLPLSQPQKPTSVEGIESAIVYLLSLYTKPGSFVIGTALGYGELLAACERMKRICFAGDVDPTEMQRSIDRWQRLTGKQAEKAP
jgi:ParB family transcriptional regulator, chromosome partitioning protein